MKSLSSVNEVIRHAVATRDDDMRWKLITELQRRDDDTEVFQAAVKLCAAESTQKKLGVDILGKLGEPDFPFRNESLEIFGKLCQTETAPQVLTSVATALGNLDDVRALKPLLALKDNPDPQVRSSVASALPNTMTAGNDPPTSDFDLGVATLIELMDDVDERVRHWATFGLSMQLDTDTPEVRAALMHRLNNPDGTFEPQALVGLARRKDTAVLQPLLDALKAAGKLEVWDRYLVVEAARELGDPRVYPALLEVHEEGWDDYPDLLQDALAECQPS